MKGFRFGVGCIAFLALWALLTAGHYRVMTPAVPVELRPWLALASALFLTLGFGQRRRFFKVCNCLAVVLA